MQIGCYSLHIYCDEVDVKLFRTLLITLLLTGCIPDMPQVPTGATCTQDGFVLRPVIHDPLDITTWEFVLEDDGSAMTCVFS